MRVLAVDYGDARTGLALSDESATLAGQAWVLQAKSRTEAVGRITAEVNSRGVSVIVVGYPKNMDGSVGPRAEISEQIADMLRASCGAEVVLWDERMTTISANRILTEARTFGKKRKKTVDAVAASLILEGYLAHRTRNT